MCAQGDVALQVRHASYLLVHTSMKHRLRENGIDLHNYNCYIVSVHFSMLRAGEIINRHLWLLCRINHVYDFYRTFSLFHPRNGVNEWCMNFVDHKSNRKAMNTNWSNQKANSALKTKTGNK